MSPTLLLHAPVTPGAWRKKGWSLELVRLMKVPNEIELPPDVAFDSELALLTYRPTGVLNEAAVNKIIKIIGELEAARQEPFNRFFDTLGQDEVDLNFRYIVHVSLYRRLTYAGRPPVKSAILATDSAIVHYARLHAMITQGSPINVRIFGDRDEAAQWLGVPVQSLQPPG